MNCTDEEFRDKWRPSREWTGSEDAPTFRRGVPIWPPLSLTDARTGHAARTLECVAQIRAMDWDASSVKPSLG